MTALCIQLKMFWLLTFHGLQFGSWAGWYRFCAGINFLGKTPNVSQQVIQLFCIQHLT